MPRRKITIEEAYSVFEQHGLQVEVKAVQSNEPSTALADFLEPQDTQRDTPKAVSKSLIKITLYAAHTISCGGELVIDKDGNKQVINNGIETYGPGVITVPGHLAQQLLHQDGLARAADERMLDKKFRSYVVVPRYAGGVMANAAIMVSDNSAFDLSSLLARMSDNNGTYII